MGLRVYVLGFRVYIRFRSCVGFSIGYRVRVFQGLTDPPIFAFWKLQYEPEKCVRPEVLN